MDRLVRCWVLRCLTLLSGLLFTLPGVEASVFRSSELSKGTWLTPGYGLELSLTSRWSAPATQGTSQGYGFQITPSYYIGDSVRLGLDLSYHFLREPVGGLHNAVRLWTGWAPLSWYQGTLGFGWAKERRNYDTDRSDIPQWVRSCRQAEMPHMFQRQQIYLEGSSNFRWGPALDLMAGYGSCQSETSQTQRRWMWASQLLISFAWR